MRDSLLERVVIPVASEDDARDTCDAALPYVAEAGGEVVAVHVVEKAGGAIDKASVEQREDNAADIFAVVEAACADAGVPCETDIAYATEIADGIFDAAREHGASAVAFTPREGSRWLDFLAGDNTRDIVKGADLPVVAFPRADGGDGDPESTDVHGDHE